MRLLLFVLISWLGLAPVVAGAAAPRFSGPAVITSAGQSSDILLARQLFVKAGVPARVSEKFAADSLAGVKSLVLVLGGSSKGLGQAKNATDKELARVDALLKKARAARVPVLCLHMGGEARRGPLSDPFIKPVVGLCQQVLVLSGGNKDGLFTRLAQAGKVPLQEATDYKALVARIAEAYGKPAGK
ncbi:MAG: DUF6305 family protein [Candidatus Delongbacteria bacterium]